MEKTRMVSTALFTMVMLSAIGYSHDARQEGYSQATAKTA